MSSTPPESECAGGSDSSFTSIPPPNERLARGQNWGVAILAALYGFAVLRSAWLCDDAYINLRTVQNFALGHGLTWNIAERVQTFTSPLWLLIFVFFHRIVFPSPAAVYYSTLGFSFAMSFAAAGILVFGLGRGPRGRLFILASLFGSKALIEFSSGGLENPLFHLLLALFCWLWLLPGERRASPFWIALAGCMVCLCRLDLVLIVGPALALELWDRRDRRTLGLLLLGFVPLVAWEIFSIIYYGFPFPNTAYAKLFAPIGAMVRLAHGLGYLSNSLRWDYPTLVSTALGFAVAVGSRDRRRIALAAGAALYVLYVVRIGGDYMTGRLLTAPAIVGLALIAEWDGKIVGRARGWIFVSAMLAASALPRHPLLAGFRGIDSAESGSDYFAIADERAWYSAHTGPVHWPPDSQPLRNRWVEEGLRDRSDHAGAAYVVVMGNIGYYGFFAGPMAHIVDEYALGDALLARSSPAPRTFRPGHLLREIPAGYLETLRTGKNVIQDAKVARLFDDLALVTRGPLWTRERWLAIMRLNFGAVRGTAATGGE